DFEKLATEYWVRVVPGSLVEMEDEKQLRILNELFVPLSQAMPALAATQNPDMIEQAAKAMHFIIGKQIELSGAASAKDIGLVWEGQDALAMSRQAQISATEERLSATEGALVENAEVTTTALRQMQEQITLMMETQQALLEKLGVLEQASVSTTGETETPLPADPGQSPTLIPASA